MALDRFLIAPYSTGLQKNVEPWLIMDDAFQKLTNSRIWRGRVRKRFGSMSMNMTKSDFEKMSFSRLRVNIGTTDGAGAFAGNVPGAIFNAQQVFSVGTGSNIEYYTVPTTGAPVNLLSTGAGSGTYNTATGALTLAGAPATSSVFFYPSEPVMSIDTYNGVNINDEDTISFDTQFAYIFSQAGGWQILGPVPPAAGSALWTGSNSDFHSVTNYRGADSSDFTVFVVNNVIADQIKYFDGTNWTSYSPIYNQASGDVIRTARIIASFKNRLLLFAPIEQVAAANNAYLNRVRFSQNGSPIAVDAFYDDVAGKGGFIEADIKEAITSIAFLRDRLIVFFEQSTWELVYTGNEVLPFVFQQIDNVLGVESVNSTLTFDKNIIGFGSTGIHACNGTNVTRIDQKIPDTIFDVVNDNFGPQRVTGIKDYYTQEVYWSYNSSDIAQANSNIFPNQVLVFNYENGAWSRNDDSITALGYYQNENNLRWQDLDYSWEDSSDQWADASLQNLFRNVVAGNQEGFTFIINAEKESNAISLYINNIATAATVFSLKIYNHNLVQGDYIYINECVSDTNSISNIINDKIYAVYSVVDANTITIIVSADPGVDTYFGGGIVTRVSRIDIISKQYNFYNSVGRQINIPRIDFLIDKEDGGQIAINYNTSFSSLDQFQIPTILPGSSILEFLAATPYENTQTKVWRSAYPYAEGSVIQYRLYYNNDQMLDKDIIWNDFQMHAVIFFTRQTSDFPR